MLFDSGGAENEKTRERLVPLIDRYCWLVCVRDFSCSSSLSSGRQGQREFLSLLFFFSRRGRRRKSLLLLLLLPSQGEKIGESENDQMETVEENEC
jgi:hypothetical protein